MKNQHQETEIEIVSSELSFSLTQLCEHCSVETTYIYDLIDIGVITTITEDESGQPKFDVSSLSRLRKAQRLQQDLELNLAGLALSMELLDELADRENEIAKLKLLLKNKIP